MAINRVSFSAEPLTQNTSVTLELLRVRPSESEYLDTPVAPNRMVGYFNNSIGRVELFITDPSGRRYIKVG